MSINKNQVWEDNQESVRQLGLRWVATLADVVPARAPGFACRRVAGNDRLRGLFLSSEIDSSRPLSAQGRGCGVIFDGALYDRQVLQNELGDFMTPAGSNDAEIILAGYLRWGEDLLKRLRGAFSLLIWDNAREILLCLRDPLGTYPLFYADSADGLLVSTSIDVLVRHPQVSSALNRAAMADYLIDRFTEMEETFFEAVSRVPPGHVLKVGRTGRRSYRYWDPAPDGVMNWVQADELERFDEFFDRAVSRCLSFGPVGIYLSGGLDSVSVAAAATELCRAQSLPKPWALSLIFPDPEISEEVVQRGVAAQLDIPHVIKPFYQATGVNGFVSPALEMSSTLPAPILGSWWPAYFGLAREGERRGCRAILTGNGGDEWLTISPLVTADLLRNFDLAGVYRFWQSAQRSYHEPTLGLFRTLMWNYGVKPLVVPPTHRLVKKVAPRALMLRRRMYPRLPKWLAPDTALRRELEQRYNEPTPMRKQASDSFYTHTMRLALDHPLNSMVLEETFTKNQTIGLLELQPFWDADLVDLLYRTPPFMLNRGGRNKGLVRNSLARRFPNLGFGHQRKLGAARFYESSVYQEGAEALRQLGKARTLTDLRIVDEPGLHDALGQLLARRPTGRAYDFWKVLNLESWARAHVS